MSLIKKLAILFPVFLIAFAILLISFQSTARGRVADNFSLKQRRFYVRKEILPDHSLYPLMMGVDRIRLGMADQERRVYLLTAYANRRLFYAKKLAEHGNTALSLTTFSKAEKYLNQALREAKDLCLSEVNNQQYKELAFFVLESVDDHSIALENYCNSFELDDKTVLDLLELETLLLAKELQAIVY